ncbi:protein of unknown function DUF1684 [Actinobacteria bacterium OK074]|nr:protein of unknown function DUF1684 [Actinobacteria bacterium OK074]
MTVQDVDRLGFAEEWERWHVSRDKALADPHGFLAVSSLRWLGPDPERFEDAPGAWSSTAEGVVVELAEGERLTVDGQPVTGRYAFGVLAERASVYAGWGDAVLEVAKRGGYDILRPRHPDNALLADFTHTPAYAPDPRWVVTGRFLPFDEPRAVTVGAAVEGLEHVYDSPGVVEFALDGTAHRLTVFDGGASGGFATLFRDATSGVTTYAASRKVQITAPDADGRVVLDFNRAVNLPCAYTDLATCPLSPAENHLSVAVEAGERIPLERGGKP